MTFVPPGFTKISDSTWSRPYYNAVKYPTTPSVLGYIISDALGANSTEKIVIYNKAPYSYEMLDINNLSCLISPFGFHFNDFESKYLEVPKHSGKKAGSLLNFWIGGYPESNHPIWLLFTMPTTMEITIQCLAITQLLEAIRLSFLFLTIH